MIIDIRKNVIWVDCEKFSTNRNRVGRFIQSATEHENNEVESRETNTLHLSESLSIYFD